MVDFYGFSCRYMDVSEKIVVPKSSISIGFSIINHLFWGTPIFGKTHLEKEKGGNSRRKPIEQFNDQRKSMKFRN